MASRRVIWAVVWLGIIGASIGVGFLPGDPFGESLCGVWGCYPPFQSFASLHLLWLAVMMPPAIALARHRPGSIAKVAGVFLAIVGVLASICVVGGGLANWGFTPSQPEFNKYAFRRIRYVLATRTDVPALQLTATGIAVFVTAHRRRRTEVPVIPDTRRQ